MHAAGYRRALPVFAHVRGNCGGNDGGRGCIIPLDSGLPAAISLETHIRDDDWMKSRFGRYPKLLTTALLRTLIVGPCEAMEVRILELSPIP